MRKSREAISNLSIWRVKILGVNGFISKKAPASPNAMHRIARLSVWWFALVFTLCATGKFFLIPLVLMGRLGAIGGHKFHKQTADGVFISFEAMLAEIIHPALEFNPIAARCLRDKNFVHIRFLYILAL